MIIPRKKLIQNWRLQDERDNIIIYLNYRLTGVVFPSGKEHIGGGKWKLKFTCPLGKWISNFFSCPVIHLIMSLIDLSHLNSKFLSQYKFVCCVCTCNSRLIWKQDGNVICRRHVQIKQLAWPMAQRQIEHRKSCLVLSARFAVLLLNQPSVY